MKTKKPRGKKREPVGWIIEGSGKDLADMLIGKFGKIKKKPIYIEDIIEAKRGK